LNLNKSIILSGSSGFLGTALVKKLCNENCKIFGLDLKNNNKNQSIKNFFFFKCDVTKENEISKSLNKIFKKNKIDCLINNAAIDHKSDDKKIFNFTKTAIKDWEKIINVNINGVFLVSKYMCRHFEKYSRGNIINIASTYGIVAPDNSIYSKSKNFKKHLAYPTSKSALIGFSKSLASYYSNSNIRVNCLSPGGIYLGQSKKFIKDYSKKTIIGRMAKLSEIVNAIKFMISDDSSYMTGSNLIVDGGWTAI
jgi:NAD(P)-dependent dehydrogenase (short-subunit alcohol dehydrogenase family)